MTTDTDNSAPFSAMVERIKRNSSDDFAGAFVIVGPGGVVIEGLLLDQGGDVGTFLGFLTNKIKVKAEEIDESGRGGNGRRF